MPPFQRALNELIAGCRARQHAIARILHVEAGPFALESGLVTPMEWLSDTHDVVMHKHVHNAFTDTVTEATLTFPMRSPTSGRIYAASEIKERTELVLADRFASIKTVRECLDAA